MKFNGRGYTDLVFKPARSKEKWTKWHTALQQAEALRQSILTKAFSGQLISQAGQLISQDPHDEPASALLAAVKAERAFVEKTATTTLKPRKPRTI